MRKGSFNRLLIVVLLGGGILAVVLAAQSAWAAPLAQFTPFPTPTPGPDGRIIYIVQANDSWWRIAAIFNIDLNELLQLNDATSETILNEGEEVLLGFGGPAEASPTPGATATAGPQLPTPTPQPGAGTLCIIVYEDVNGDSIRQEEEPSIPGGAISVSDREGDVSLTETTRAGFDPQCFQDLPQGEYNISVAVPEGFNPTTVMNYALVVEPGAETFLDFGAQASSAALSETPPEGARSRSLLLGIAGGLLLLGGAGLAAYAALMGRERG